VTINRTINDANSPRPISGAVVTVTDETLNQYLYKETRTGYYELEPGNTPQPGKSYTLEVKLINGKVYRSQAEVMPSVIGTDSLYYDISEDAFESQDFSRIVHLLYVRTKSKLPPAGKYYLRWETDEVYYWNLTDFPDPFNTPPPDCIAYDRVNPQRINLLNGTTVNASSSEQLVAQRELDYTFRNRHYLIVRQFSTTQKSYEYWQNIRTVLNNTGSPFDIPPAPIASNIANVNDPDEIVLGYFEACRQTNQRFFLVPGFIPYFIEPYCDYVPGKDFGKYPIKCLDCDKMPNSTNVIPPWFL
jgi:hypothetical protein